MRAASHLTALCFLLMVDGCSGGSHTDSPARNTAEGQWLGTVNFNGDSARSFGGVVLNDGSYWFLYSLPGNDAVVDGMVQGTSVSDGAGNFSSSDGALFSFGNGGPFSSFTATGTYQGSTFLKGSLGTSSPFNTSYDHNYDGAPSLTTIAGTYSGTGGLGTSAGLGTSFVENFTIDATGQISGSVTVSGSVPCALNGTASLHSSGNVYDLTVQLSTCGLGPYSGIAIYDSSDHTLSGALVSSDRTQGVAIVANN